MTNDVLPGKDCRGHNPGKHMEDWKKRVGKTGSNNDSVRSVTEVAQKPEKMY